jgi:hypothetical protein
MAALARVTAVEHLGARLLRVTFSDGLVRELDFADALPGVLATIDDDEVFAGVAVDAVAGTISWPNGIDLDPDVLHGDDASASAIQARVVREYRLQQTS